MNKAELVAAVAEKTNFTKKDAEVALNAVLASIEETLVKGDKVQLIGLVKLIIIIGVFKGKRHNSRVYKICNMNTRKALCNNRANAQIHRHKRRMLARGALTVVTAAYNYALTQRLCALGEGLITHRKAEL